jgi:hypothetical protein
MLGVIVAGQPMQTPAVRLVNQTAYAADLCIAEKSRVCLFLMEPIAAGAMLSIYAFPGDEQCPLCLLSNSKPSAFIDLPEPVTSLGILLGPEDPSPLIVNSSSASQIGVAQNVVRHLFNYVASFRPNATDPSALVPLRVFNDWYVAIQRKLQADPGLFSRPCKSFD